MVQHFLIYYSVTKDRFTPISDMSEYDLGWIHGLDGDPETKLEGDSDLDAGFKAGQAEKLEKIKM